MKQPLRVLQGIVANDKGGLTGYICQNYRCIDKSKVQFDFVTYDNALDFEEEFKQMGAKFYRLPRASHVFSYFRAMSKLQKEMHYEIVHYNMSYANIIPLVIAKAVGIKKVILHSHSTQIDSQNSIIRNIKECLHKVFKKLIPFVADAYYACSTEAAEWMFPRSIIKNKKFQLCHNAIDTAKFTYDEIKRKKKRAELGIAENDFVVGHIGRFTYQNDYINYMNKTAKIFIAVSDAVKEHWINKGLDKKRIVRIYNGVKIQESPKIQDTPLNNKNEIKLVMTGGIQETKGQIQAIELMASLKRMDKRYSLDLIGDGGRQYIKQLKDTICANGLDNSVRFLGYRNDVFDLLPNYDIGLICSKDEGFGRVTAEYMMAGLPVLALNTGANSELIREGVDGYLYSYGNIEDMKEKLMRIIDHNLGGDNTHKYSMNTFSAKVNAENVYRIYKIVLGEN